MGCLFLFHNVDLNSEFALPVTPPSFKVSHGIKVETINIDTVGDVNIPTYQMPGRVQIDCMFPAQYYPFCNFTKMIGPYEYVKLLQGYEDNKFLLRFIVSGTTVNLPVKLTEMEYGEQDGTGDVYAELTLDEIRQLAAVKAGTTPTGGNLARPGSSAAAPAKASNYTVVRGDTLSAICRRQYGDAGLYPKLAAYNKIKNANLIYVGQVIRLPAKSQL